MDLAITLLAPYPGAELLLKLAAEIAPGAPTRWLAEAVALDVAVQGELEKMRARAREICATVAADVCVQPLRGRKKRMLIADMDATIIGQESLDEMADVSGLKPKIAELTRRAMAGELDFQTAVRERLKLLAGFKKAQLKHVLDHRITLNPGAEVLVRTMAAGGAHTVLVSGGFTDFTAVVAERAGFAKSHANVFVWNGDELAGAVEPILGRKAKLEVMEAECARLGIAPADVVAVGDGANDLDMLAAAGLGVAYHAKPVVAAQAHAEVRHADLTALLYYQGYRREEFKATVVAPARGR